MKTAAIVAEYNPFHNGHRYHVTETRKNGCDFVIAVMSGNFVQRGMPAIAERFLRAQIAVQCGIDLVIELPLPWSISAAQDFADGATQIIKSTGIVDVLSFGCESTELQLHNRTVAVLQNDNIQKTIKQFLACGHSYPMSLSKALDSVGETAICEFLAHPNNVLATEYCKCINDTDIIPMPIQRIGCAHDDHHTSASFASASYIRNEIYNTVDLQSITDNLTAFMPNDAVSLLSGAIADDNALVNFDKFNIASVARLQMLSADDYSCLPHVGDGMQFRLHSSVQNAVSFLQACDFAKNKQVTHARIRRTLLQAVLGMHKHPVMKKVPYIRVLAASRDGCELLKRMKTTATLPVIIRHADTAKLDPYGLQVYNFNQSANSFYNLCLPLSSCATTEMTKNIYIEK